jgi:Protein of unknown function (DUF2585)
VSADRVRQMAAGSAIALIVLTGALVLRSQGRLWICACGKVYVWAGDIWSAHNSQHLLDPYSFTHVLHGFAFFWVVAWLLPRLWPAWQLTLTILLETIWEVIENSQMAIERYRAATISIGYAGDTIVNSIGDVIVCGAGFWLARYLGFRISLIVFCLTELVLLIWIRDSLVLNIIMLIYPVDAIKAWQLG